MCTRHTDTAQHQHFRDLSKKKEKAMEHVINVSCPLCGLWTVHYQPVLYHNSNWSVCLMWKIDVRNTTCPSGPCLGHINRPECTSIFIPEYKIVMTGDALGIFNHKHTICCHSHYLTDASGQRQRWKLDEIKLWWFAKSMIWNGNVCRFRHPLSVSKNRIYFPWFTSISL